MERADKFAYSKETIIFRARKIKKEIIEEIKKILENKKTINND